MILRLILFLLFVIVFEALAYRAVIKLFTTQRAKKKARKLFWLFVALLIASALILYALNMLSPSPEHVQFRRFFNITGLFLLNFVPKLGLILFSTIHDIFTFFLFLGSSVSGKKTSFPILKKIWMSAGIVVSALLFFQLIYGMIWGKAQFAVNEIVIESERIPPSFDKFRIAHISDLHLGSFKNDRILKRGIKEIMAQTPSVIFITGDIVNNEASEFSNFKSVLAKLHAPYGIYSILGNHDMGDYRHWYTETEKHCNLRQLVALQEELGWYVLRNNHRYIAIEEDSVAIVGVLNWGKPPFKTYGDLNAARHGVNDSLFSVLLSHDPSHWENEVLYHTPVDLTLSGHTHGFQYALGFGRFKFSPVQLKYKHWAGLYRENGQYLYVNTGFGFIGFSGRVGVKPEITMITLKRIT